MIVSQGRHLAHRHTGGHSKNFTNLTKSKIISVFLNLIPRNIIIVSNFLTGPKNILSDKYFTQKYHFG